jgi:hypothetical protein
MQGRNAHFRKAAVSIPGGGVARCGGGGGWGGDRRKVELKEFLNTGKKRGGVGRGMKKEECVDGEVGGGEGKRSRVV